jgi:hypothetical protein
VTASLGAHAEENLRFIRVAMERGSTFSAVSGVEGIAMGTVGLVAAFVAANQSSADRWLLVWLFAALLAVPIGVTAMWRKAARGGVTLTGALGRRFALGVAAPLVAGGAITFGLWRGGEHTLMGPTWLLLYGAGVVVGGMFSVPAVRAMGLCLMTIGIAAVFTPAGWSNGWLALGFGGLQIGFGIHIARHHGR